MAVQFPPTLVLNPETGLPLTEVWGQQVLLVEEGTDTALVLSEDAEGNIPIPNPVRVTSLGFLPRFWVQGTATRAEAVSTNYRSPIWSPQALEQAAVAAAAAASSAAADVTSRLAAVDSAVQTALQAAGLAEQIVADVADDAATARLQADAAVQAVSNRAPLEHTHGLEDLEVEGTPGPDTVLTGEGWVALDIGPGGQNFFLRWDSAQSRWETVEGVPVETLADAQNEGLIDTQVLHFLGGTPPAWATSHPGEVLWDRDTV